MRKKFLLLIASSLFFLSCSINPEERSYEGKRAIVLVNHNGGVGILGGTVKSISRDEIILEDSPVGAMFLLNEKYSQVAKEFIDVKATLIIKRSEVIAIAIITSDNEK